MTILWGDALDTLVVSNLNLQLRKPIERRVERRSEDFAVDACLCDEVVAVKSTRSAWAGPFLFQVPQFAAVIALPVGQMPTTWAQPCEGQRSKFKRIGFTMFKVNRDSDDLWDIWSHVHDTLAGKKECLDQAGFGKISAFHFPCPYCLVVVLSVGCGASGNRTSIFIEALNLQANEMHGMAVGFSFCASNTLTYLNISKYI